MLRIVARLSPYSCNNYDYRAVKYKQNCMTPSLQAVTVRPMILEEHNRKNCEHN